MVVHYVFKLEVAALKQGANISSFTIFLRLGGRDLPFKNSSMRQKTPSCSSFMGDLGIWERGEGQNLILYLNKYDNCFTLRMIQGSR